MKQPLSVSFGLASSLQLVHPFRLVALSAPATPLQQLVVQALAGRARGGEQTGVIIGHNRFDVYMLTRLARSHGFDPMRWLTAIQLSRAFTCHQLNHRVMTLDRAATREWSALFVLGLLDTFYDESVEFDEAARLLNDTLSALKQLARDGLPVLITTSFPKQAGREYLVRLVAGAADDFWELATEMPRLTAPAQLALPWSA